MYLLFFMKKVMWVVDIIRIEAERFSVAIIGITDFTEVFLFSFLFKCFLLGAQAKKDPVICRIL